MSASMMSETTGQLDVSGLQPPAGTDEMLRGPAFGIVVGFAVAVPMWGIIGWIAMTVL
jgi:hypothetical protein